MPGKKGFILLLLAFYFWWLLLIEPFPFPGHNKPEGKIRGDVYAALGKKDYVPVIVVLEKRIKGLQDASPEKGAEFPSAEGFIESLKKTAWNSQREILPIIEEEMKKGNLQGYTPFWIVNAFAAQINREALKRLAELPQVKEIRGDQQYSLFWSHFPGNDEEGSFNTPATRESSGSDYAWNLEIIRAPLVWQQGIYGRDVVVAIMDTGVDLNHPALKDSYRGNLPGHSHETSWYDATADSSRGNSGPVDTIGHGTHIAGVILGGSPGEPLGVAPGARWIAVNIFNKGYAWDSHIIQGFQWLMAPGGDPRNAPRIINCSWASRPEYVRDYLQWEILYNLEKAGIFVVFAAGNNGASGPGSPASYPHAFAVGALKQEGEGIKIAEFSSRGPVSWQGVLYTKPEITAPGINIRSSWLNNGYNVLDGTSLAAAHVSGAAALLLEARPGLSPPEIKAILQQTASWEPSWDEGGRRPNNIYGYGLLNIYAAVNSSLLPARETLWEDGAEDGIINWNTSPENPWKITREKVYGGNFAFADSPWEKYKNNTRSWLALARPISLCGYHSPLLSFWHYYDLTTGKIKDDYGYVEISIDGQSWISLYRFSGTNGSFSYFSLPLYLPAGANNIYLRFRLESNNNGPGGGWYLDDISLTAVPLPLTALERLKLASNRTIIGAGESIAIKAEAFFCPRISREIPPELLKWSSANPAVATVEKGVVKGVSAGETVIRGSFAGFVDEISIEVIEVKAPVARPEPGTYLNAVTLELIPTTPGARVYYTLDGREPDAESLLYEKPLTLTENKVIRAREYLAGIFGPVKEFSYTVKEGASVTGTITLQGRSRHDSQINIFFINLESGESHQLSGLSPGGKFLRQLPLGSYILVAKREHYLTRTAKFKLEAKDELQEVNLILLAGDLNNDNRIDIHDLTMLALAYGSTPRDQNWNSLADLNGDGKIDMGDLTMLAQNFGLQGDT